jgi:hypothetical protein
MRKHLIWVLGLAVALAFAGVAAGAANTQSITGKVTPKKLPKKSKAPVALSINVSSTNPSNPQAIPNATTLAKVDFDKDIKVQQKGLPTCDATQFGSQSTTQDVKQACPDAIIGSGSATILLRSGPGAPPLTVHAQTVAANVKGNKILLHSYTQEAGGVPLVGSFIKSDGGSKYGQELSVPVPALAGGQGVITQFGVNTKKLTYKFHHKTLSYASASCKDKKIQFQARFTDDQGNVAKGTSTQKCKQKG